MADAGPVVTFTPEAIAGMDATMLGELVQDRVRRGARTIRIATLDEVGSELWRRGQVATEELLAADRDPERPDAD